MDEAANSLRLFEAQGHGCKVLCTCVPGIWDLAIDLPLLGAKQRYKKVSASLAEPASTLFFETSCQSTLLSYSHLRRKIIK